MAGKVLVLEDVLSPDNLGVSIASSYISWDNSRQMKVTEWQEVQKYVFATDTTKTSNSKLPWSNKTTIPKICQIRDNLFSNYMASMFPKRKWLLWEGDTPDDDSKTSAIESYMAWVIDRNEFYDEIAKVVLDYIDYGNCFGTVEWVDQRNSAPSGKQQVGYVGPVIRRINPLDIVFNPIAPSFNESPKIVRSMVSLGEVKEMISRMSLDDGEKEDAEALYTYMKDIRQQVSSFNGTVQQKNETYQLAGFNSYAEYLGSNTVEILTFYGDIYDAEKDEFLRNQIIKVVDRHKILSKKTNPSFFGSAPIYHAGWRIRPDNLWAMGPLDNLIGMQYRIDHLENLKADVFDLIAFPLIKIKGYVEDFQWQPFERIYIGDDGDVALMSPDVEALKADNQIAILESKMEEMSGSPKEAMGFRTPGEKTAYEVQRLENAAGRIFQNKIAQFERTQTESMINAMLELARRHLDQATIRVFSSEFKINMFKDLTAEDITGNGRIRPIAARHFAEQATMLQNLNNFFTSAMGHDPLVISHFSSIKTAELMEHLLNIEDFNIVQPFVRLAEQADAQRLQNSHQEQVATETQTAGNILPGDHDPGIVPQNVTPPPYK